MRKSRVAVTVLLVGVILVIAAREAWLEATDQRFKEAALPLLDEAEEEFKQVFEKARGYVGGEVKAEEVTTSLQNLRKQVETWRDRAYKLPPAGRRRREREQLLTLLDNLVKGIPKFINALTELETQRLTAEREIMWLRMLQEVPGRWYATVMDIKSTLRGEGKAHEH
ncbi:MAG TPA: hypothetical protein EYP85_13930 [Armatimonadetes bacterium]|nr:hypothetical protein [Armatimonadota bacterium]